MSQKKLFPKTESTQKFKIKMSGGGFRKIGRSVSTHQLKIQNGIIKHKLKPTTSDQFYKKN